MGGGAKEAKAKTERSMMKPSLCENLEAIVKMALARVVTCHHDKILAWDVPEALASCPDCEGTGQMPDPAFAGLLEVIREPCTRLHAVKFGPQGEVYHLPACECGGTGQVLRDWSVLPDTALLGALLGGMWSIGYAVAERHGISSPQHGLVSRAIENLTDLFGYSTAGVPVGEIACSLVHQFLEARKEA